MTPDEFVAVTVKIEEPPAVTDAGFAVIVTVGAPEPEDETVMVDSAFAEPPGPVALAVYVVVAAGLTLCVPPAAGNVYELPSEPVIVTVVAFAAVTESVDVVPAATVVGLADMLTVGAGLATLPLTPPHPASSTSPKPRIKNSRETNRQNFENSGDTGALPRPCAIECAEL